MRRLGKKVSAKKPPRRGNLGGGLCEKASGRGHLGDRKVLGMKHLREGIEEEASGRHLGEGIEEESNRKAAATTAAAAPATTNQRNNTSDDQEW